LNEPDHDDANQLKPVCVCVFDLFTNSNVDQCVRAFDRGEKSFAFSFSFTAPGSFAPPATTTGTSKDQSTPSSSNPSSSTLFDPKIDPVTHTGFIEANVTSAANCTTLKSFAKDFCSGLPEEPYTPDHKNSPYSECLAGYNQVADSCAKAFEQGAKGFKFYFSFTAPQQKNTTSGSTGSITTANDQVTVTYQPNFDSKTLTGTLSVTAKSKADCDFLKTRSSMPGSLEGFCDGLPNKPVGANKRNLYEICINGYNRCGIIFFFLFLLLHYIWFKFTNNSGFFFFVSLASSTSVSLLLHPVNPPLNFRTALL
jgi:hypothetical protein